VSALHAELPFTIRQMSKQPDFRALCDELLEALDDNDHSEYTYDGDVYKAMKKVRAALAEPTVTPIPIPERLPGPEDVREMAWALIQMLDGVALHDLHGILGLDQSDCLRIWKARDIARVIPLPELPQPQECETCHGVGTIDEQLGGFSFSNPEATCPDCDGTGELKDAIPLPKVKP
jgi:hypothetical protein